MHNRQLSTISIDANEDQKIVDEVTKAQRNLVQQLRNIGVNAQRVPSLPVDVVWSVDGRSCMFDLKTPDDFIASAQDGRLHQQMTDMQRANCLVYGFIIEGRWSQDDETIGYGTHAWSWDRFDNLVMSVECEGAKILHSPRVERTARRIHSVYVWTGKSATGSWHAPVKPAPTLHERYIDRSYRKHIESLMGLLPDMGEKRANLLLDTYSFMDVLGITEDGLREASARWRSVRGIGDGLVRNWEAYLREDFSPPIRVNGLQAG